MAYCRHRVGLIVIRSELRQTAQIHFSLKRLQLCILNDVVLNSPWVKKKR